jgi:hypothetical protein
VGNYTNPWATFKRGALAILTSGTSEMKTGGGVYGDETVADSLFPKGVNDVALDERANARAGVDAKAAAEKAQLEADKPGPAPDFTDETLSAARRSSKLRASMAYGRAATFSSGVKRQTLLGG